MKATGLVLLGFVAAAAAGIPKLISYQARVTDASGNPVADGTYGMRFRIYDAAVGGSVLWDSGNQSVTVSGGVFSVLLGEPPQPALNLPFDTNYWLLVTFDGVDQSPRQRLASVGYAYMASGLVPGTEVSGAVNTGTSAAIKGSNTATAAAAAGLHGVSASTSGRGVVGEATATSGFTYGVLGSSSSTAGRGVYGSASASSGITHGGMFISSSMSGRGVYGSASSTTGTTYGVYGVSSSTEGTGVYGTATATTGTTYGGFFASSSPQGTGVQGSADATVGPAYGVYGVSSSTAGRGVFGAALTTSGVTYGVYGSSSSADGRGVYGIATATSGTTYGVFGVVSSSLGTGVYGTNNATSGTAFGVFGQTASPTGRGVCGVSVASSGITFGVYGYAVSQEARAVYGVATATTGTTYGVYGTASSPNGYGVYCAGNLAASGSKSCVVNTSRGPTLLYCQESPENWFEDFGEGVLMAGRARVELDPLFLETVSIDEANPMKVFIELGGACRGVYVERGRTGFSVIEQDGGTSTVPFWYRVVAKRKGYEARRLERCAAAERDPFLYPEVRELEEVPRASHEETGAD